jgi:hypothetical protein
VTLSQRGYPAGVHPKVVGGRWLALAFGVRQSSGALTGAGDSGRGLPQSKTLARSTNSHGVTNNFEMHFDSTRVNQLLSFFQEFD